MVVKNFIALPHDPYFSNVVITNREPDKMRVYIQHKGATPYNNQSHTTLSILATSVYVIELNTMPIAKYVFIMLYHSDVILIKNFVKQNNLACSFSTGKIIKDRNNNKKTGYLCSTNDETAAMAIKMMWS